MLTILYVFAVLAVIQGIVTLVDGLRAARYMRDYRPPAFPANPRIAVFCPCKGVDHDFQGNIRSILDQDYPNYQVYFIVESSIDPAYGALNRMGTPPVGIAGLATSSGQKVYNLCYGLETVSTDVEIFVFCDSDARYPEDWLTNLIAPLTLGEKVVSTGYRWYVASRFHPSTLLRSAWNASVVSMLGDHERNFAWGGSMAMRRETFNELGVLEEWRGSVSDDYSVTRAARKAHARITFVPQCLIPSFGDCSLSEMLEFTTRQIQITRVYHPRLWRIGFLAQTVFCVTFFGLSIAMFQHPVAVFLWLVIYALAGAKSAVRHHAISERLGDPALSRFGWFYILFSPVVAFVYEYNMVRSAFSREIKWRQIQYTLLSPNQTRVRH